MGNVVATVIREWPIDKDENIYQRAVKLGFTGTYATNGDTLVAAEIAKLMPSGVLADMAPPIISPSKTGRVAWLDQAANKLKVFAAGAEVGNTTNLTADEFIIYCTFEDVLQNEVFNA